MGLTLYPSNTVGTWAGALSESCAAAASDGLGVAFYISTASKTAPSLTSHTITIYKKEINTGLIMEYPLPTSHNIEAGDWTMRFRTARFGGNANIQWRATYICLCRFLGESASTISTLGYLDGQTTALSSESTTYTMTVNVPTAATGLTYRDLVYVVYLFKNTNVILDHSVIAAAGGNFSIITTIEEVGTTTKVLGTTKLVGKCIINP